ncbi:uncharacterized protein HGUI_01343 [Hanseniaspora guilliermondii]|uniref:Uncharacterized protein n=1 Tax=Hanseniaspora guilliermondii TaxID=56406 RepID=A0A1L0CWF9_9ASCO|nr:uncharacterized protein HGUI_01343 [Hanseniaspora guilliermondii]
MKNKRKLARNTAKEAYTEYPKKGDIIKIFQHQYEHSNSSHIHNILYGDIYDYCDLNYDTERFNIDGVSTRDIDTYDVQKHKFIDEYNLNGNWNTAEKKEVIIEPKLLFPLSDFVNNVHEKYESYEMNTKRQNKKKSQFSKKQLNRYYKLAIGEKKPRRYIANNSDDDEEESNSDEEILMDDEDYQVSDDESDSYLVHKFSKPSLSICNNFIKLENMDVKIIGLAVKNGYLNFKLIDKNDPTKNDGISLYLKALINDISSVPNENSSNLGLVVCTLKTGDLFFIEFFYEPTNESLKSQITYKFNILRKSNFQHSPFKDIKFLQKDITDCKNVYNFVIIDRYGNYTNGKIESKKTENNLVIEIESCLDDDESFKGVMFDPMNIELPYKAIIPGPHEDTLFLVDNTKIVSVNKRQKSAFLIAQFKFWSNVIDSYDIEDFFVIITNFEIKIFEKTVNDSKVALLKNVLSIRHYLNLARYDELGLSASFNKEKSSMIIFIKKYKQLYAMKINTCTKELKLINNLPLLIEIAGKNSSTNEPCALFGTNLVFLGGSEYNKNVYTVDISSLLEESFLMNLNAAVRVECNEILKNSNKDLKILERFESNFAVKNRIKKAILRGKQSTKDDLRIDNSSAQDRREIVKFADRFYQKLIEIFQERNAFGCIKMSDIEALPDFLLNAQLFYEFNVQFTRSIKENTPFRVTNFYNEIDEKPQNIWNNQMIMYCDRGINVKEKIVYDFSKGFNFEPGDKVYEGLKAWNPSKLFAYDEYQQSIHYNTSNSHILSRIGNPHGNNSLALKGQEEESLAYNFSFRGKSKIPSSQLNFKDIYDDSIVASTQNVSKPKELSLANDSTETSKAKEKKEKKTRTKNKSTKSKAKKPKMTSGFF